MNDLIADAFFNDPVIIKAKADILTTIEKYKTQITAVRPALSELKTSYAQAVQQIGSLRGQDLYYPYIGSGFGNGVFVELADGSIKYDFISGIGTHWGHFHPQLVESSLRATLQDVGMQTNLQQDREVQQLMSFLTKGSGLDHCFLTSSGAMANENALKILYQKKAPASRLLAFERCFMGRTLALAQITDKPQFKQGLPVNLQVDYVPFYDWRCPKQSTEISLSCLERHLNRYPNAHACMCFEMIQGEAGSYPGTHEFFLALMKKLKFHGIPIFVDEVQTFGRTDHLFAFQHFGLQEYVDIVSCGKLLHTCATLFRSDFRPQPGLLSQTYITATSSIYIAKTLIKNLIEDGYLGVDGKNMHIHHYFATQLQNLEKKYPDRIEGPFGYGLMIACTPFKGDKDKVNALAQALFDAGLITFIAGSRPTRLRFLVPPGSITFQDIDAAMTILEKTVLSL